MRRYHKKVYVPIDSQKHLKAFTDSIQGLNWHYTPHSIDNLRYRHIDSRQVLLFIKGLRLDYKSIFEYYTTDTREILKACYRVNFTSDIDLILVIDKNKTIITIYINSVDDNHFTLDKGLYVKDEKVS